MPLSAGRGRHCFVSVSFIYMKKNGGEELWRLHRLSCWQSKQQQKGTQSPWKGAGVWGGHCRMSRARLISEPVEKFIYFLSSKRESRAGSHENKSDMNGVTLSLLVFGHHHRAKVSGRKARLGGLLILLSLRMKSMCLYYNQY